MCLALGAGVMARIQELKRPASVQSEAWRVRYTMELGK